ncbi:bifunctional glycosyltransferase/CDP-glycerol:glycerophosphate glycerophosphotransferase [Verrucosispora sp. WMMC514]|uniref:bifunctional glycosyltransferase/CDP-glycerol:glycerophosphate glycerophosphotransferase n=1 Tax=Verrucosispora sp. WMMC514 TaxID=3015156 RepID=UPI00248B9558|nr:bifunctional glycosyltransferase/CDP-glycerol:glycerophosphate glycerophosphotransferase [Verrucosispora sp. WMMC514]WBB89341.1 CDP-glycerol glycerophosphotransferase family protein [Verrucosispora sp. WMMC514]
MSNNALLSVVVPAHDVQTFLDDCLNSIANQTYRNLEVIVVDDGSVDGTGQIAEQFASRDPRFRVIHQEEGGPGRARNVGIQAATGTYLAFVDGDDLLPPYAYTMAIACLESTGSDFVSGDVRQFTSRGATPSPMHAKIFPETKLRTHVSQHSALLKDRTVWNKVFRRRFWDEHGLVFPEGVVFEDVPVAVLAHAMASTVDVLNVPVYYWRRRESGEASITQRTTDWATVADRFRAVDRVSRFLAEHGQRGIKRAYDANALVDDLALVLRALPDADDAFREAFLDRANDFLDRVDPRVLKNLRAKYRVQWHLVRQRMMPELIEVVLATRGGMPVPTTMRGLRRYADLPFLDDPRAGLPRELYRLPDPPAQSKLHDLIWRDGRLVLRGHAYAEGAKAARPWSSGRLLWLREQRTRRAVMLRARPRRCPDATVDSKHGDCSYEWSGFETVVDPASLKKDGKWVEGVWRLAVGVVSKTGLRKTQVRLGTDPVATWLNPHYVDETVRIVPLASAQGVSLRIEEVRARLTSYTMVGDTLEVRGEIRGPSPVAGRIRLSRAPGVPEHWVPATFGEQSGQWTSFQAVIPLASLFPDPTTRAWTPPPGAMMDRWRVEIALYSGGKKAIHLIANDGLPQARTRYRGRDVYVRATAAGYVWLCARAAAPVVTDVTWTDNGTLVLTGDHDGSGEEPEITLRLRGSGERRVLPVTSDGEVWRAEIAPRALPLFGGRVELQPGMWDLLCQISAGTSPALTNLTFAEAVLRGLPAATEIDGRSFAVTATGAESAGLNAGSMLLPDEQGAYYRKRLRESYQSARARPRRETVLFDSFSGRQYSDSPRAVHEEMIARGVGPAEHLWVVRDGRVSLPATARAVRHGGRDWYEALASSRYIVTNTHLPDWFQRAPEQTVVQLWHGTPLKRIGFDVTEVRHADRNYLTRVEKEVPNWSFLVSPNRFSTPILRRAFRFGGEILESGYPRNDVLYQDRDAVAAEVRRRLGLPAGKKVVLYAPTWRDDEFHSMGRYKMTLMLDLAEARAKLGYDHVLLVRRHPNVVDEIPGAGDGFVWDVSRYPDVADLLALTDVLVTDYSSLMFDFANTRRPMLFFTYDLEHYRDKLRGFYFDFESEAPGPLLGTSTELVDAIRRADLDSFQYQDRYDAFVERFCDLDDGKATSRVIERLLS